MGRRHSVSSTYLYLECPRAWYLRHVKRIREERQEVPVPWRIGTAVHSSLEAAYRARQETRGRIDSMREFEPHAIEALEKSWQELNLPRSHGAYDNQVANVQNTLDSVSCPESPDDVLAVEEKIEDSTPDGTLFIGYPDLVLRVDKRTIRVRDWKVTSRTSSAEQIATDLQTNAYAWFLKRRWPWVERVLISNYYPPLQQEVEVLAKEDEMDSAIECIETVAEMTESDEAFEPNPGDHCDPCQYKAHCPIFSTQVEALKAVEGF